MTTNPDLPPTRPAASRVASVLLPLGPLVVLVIVGCINGLGAWPAFRQQDTSILHWILASNSEVLRGLSQEQTSPEAKPLKSLINPLRDYLTLENLNLSGLNLTSSDLGDMSIENVNFAGARLENANFSCTDLSHVNFSGAKLMNSRFNYGDCQSHISTKRLQCVQQDLDLIANTEWADEPKLEQPRNLEQLRNKVICLEGRFVGADFSNAQIRGAFVKRSDLQAPCKQLLVLVGDMSGASFKSASLTCVALIHRPASPALPLQEWAAKVDGLGKTSQPPETNNQPPAFTFNGISFQEARLNRVALLSGPFRFTQFERADLIKLFLNIGTSKNASKADLDYSMFNEINCKLGKDPTKDRPCLSVTQEAGERQQPLRLNFLWSTISTNLKPSKKDRFLCTPAEDLPAWFEGRMFQSARYMLHQTGKSPTQLRCDSTHLLPTGPAGK